MIRLFEFVKDTVKYTKDYIVGFTKGMVQHAETATILTLSAVGLNTLLGELPFIYQLPLWIEATMVIPAISVIAISLLLKSAELRARKRYIAF